MPTTENRERSISLPAEARSARKARQFVARLLDEAGHQEWQEAAALAVSEIVTNAVLHANTPLTLTARVADDSLRIDVLDHNPTLPSVRRYDETATTGRGMSMVAAVTTTHGVTSLGAEGKVVWFTLDGRHEDLDVDALLDGWDDDAPVAAQEPPPGVRVTLRGMPATLWLAARQRHDALLRELALFRAGDPGTGESLALANRARWIISLALDRAIAQAQEQGLARAPLPDGHPATLPAVPPLVDLELSVPPDLGPAYLVLQAVLDEAESLAVAGRLLIRPALPEIVAVRNWACEQVVTQLAGTAPVPWAGADAAHFSEAAGPVGLSSLGWDPTAVQEATRGAVAADDANRIVAVSRPFAQAYGWAADELVGRRVVALVPPRFREAHVAGFTRHLTTGEAHVLGVPLVLPVLRPDGTEVESTFLIESDVTQTGRTVYIAWISPTAP